MSKVINLISTSVLLIYVWLGNEIALYIAITLLAIAILMIQYLIDSQTKILRSIITALNGIDMEKENDRT
jgi:heme exporter protein D